MTIAVLFGSFNPVHNGHVAIAERFLEEDDVDEVWLSVSPQNPWKERDGLMPMEDRVAMCQLATEHNGSIRVVDFEKDLPQPSFTYEALQDLQAKNSSDEFILIIGGDNYESFHLWRNAEQIISKFKVWAYPRDNNEQVQVEGIRMLDAPLLAVSSTQVRELASSDAGTEDIISPKVKQYLAEMCQ